MSNYNYDDTLNASVITDFNSPPLKLTRKLAAEYCQSRVIQPLRDPHRKPRYIVGTRLPNHCIATVTALTA
jgi:hypothetical protein